MRSIYVLCALAAASAKFCEEIPLPSGAPCACTEPTAGGFQLECKATVGGASNTNTNSSDASFGADAVFQFQPCADPATMGFTATITVAGDDFPLEDQTLTAGDTAHVPVPDASVAGIGGVFVDATLEGNAASLSVDLSLDVCASAFGIEKCGLIPGVTPLELYKDELDFSSICNAEKSPKTLASTPNSCSNPGDCGRAYQACCIGFAAKGFPCGCHLADGGSGQAGSTCGDCGTAYKVCCAGFAKKGYPCTCDVN